MKKDRTKEIAVETYFLDIAEARKKLIKQYEEKLKNPESKAQATMLFDIIGNEKVKLSLINDIKADVLNILRN